MQFSLLYYHIFFIFIYKIYITIFFRFNIACIFCIVPLFVKILKTNNDIYIFDIFYIYLYIFILFNIKLLYFKKVFFIYTYLFKFVKNNKVYFYVNFVIVYFVMMSFAFVAWTIVIKISRSIGQ